MLSKVPKNASVGWRGYCTRILGCAWYFDIIYLEEGKTINNNYNMALLDRLSTEIKRKWPHMQKEKVMFHQDNAPYHKSMEMMVKLNELSFKLLPHPPYSLDLTPSDDWLFADLKKCSRERDLAPLKK